MPANQLKKRIVHKVWGKRELPPPFDHVGTNEEPVGEIWFQEPDGPLAELLVKYLFTSERLSVQVHPNDDHARRLGYRSGKDEAWVVLAAEPEATIGLGLTRAFSKEELRAAALDGSIEDLLDWRPTSAGDVFYLPAGTVHAIGPGLVLVEVQQNVDVTFRLYDYGRPRELHLDEGVEAARPEPYRPPESPRQVEAGRELLVAGSKFVVERWRDFEGATGSERPFWLITISGAVTVEGAALPPGEVFLTQGPAAIKAENADLLVAYAGPDARNWKA